MNHLPAQVHVPGIYIAWSFEANDKRMTHSLSTEIHHSLTWATLENILKWVSSYYAQPRHG
jgi:hypothetical protein